MGLPNDRFEGFQPVTVQGKFSSEFWELLKLFEDGKLGWLSNSVMQSLPKGTVFRRREIAWLPEFIFLSLVVLLPIILHCAEIPVPVQLSVLSWPLLRGGERTPG